MSVKSRPIYYFDSVEEAKTWIEKEADDPHVDNIRLAQLSDPEQMAAYAKKYAKGCCGFNDELVYIDKLGFCLIGCNFGH